MKDNRQRDLLRSTLTLSTSANSIASISTWLDSVKRSSRVTIETVPLGKLGSWRVDAATGHITHMSGRFFSVEGIHVETNWRGPDKWDQPIINQPEIGYLGLLAQRHDDVLHFLIQGKIEPGNINTVQLSPTLQATKSNYMLVHKGNRPPFLEYFNGEKKVDVILDQLQSEQGGRFLRKRNRNIVVEIPRTEKIEVPFNFTWVTLGQLKKFLDLDNVVNMDTRSVIAGISCINFAGLTAQSQNYRRISRNSTSDLFYSTANDRYSINNLGSIISWITKLKATYELRVTSKPIKEMSDWRFDGETLSHKDKKYFSVIGVNVEIDGREVIGWDQPMIKSSQQGLIAFIIKKFNGVYHFLVQAKLESGNFDVIELAPTVQCLTGNYRTGLNEYSVPFINDVLDARPKSIIYSGFQSEEGGRFFKEQNWNLIVEVFDSFPAKIPENYCWMTLRQLSTFLLFNNYLNIAARSLISVIRP